MLPVDELAQEIRRVDGSNSLGAGALAEALMPFFATREAESVAVKPIPIILKRPDNLVTNESGSLINGHYIICLELAISMLNMQLPPSSPPAPHVAEIPEWRTMDTAPLDGKHCLLAVPEPSGFIYTVQGAYQNGQWNAVHRDNVQPIYWMPNMRLPAAPHHKQEGGDT